MKIFVEPNDVLMFRDGRPFAGGSDHFARCVFPPSPATIYGALRSHILSCRWPEFGKFATSPEAIPAEIRAEIGDPNKTGSLKINSFALACKDKSVFKRYFPTPRDVVKKKGSKENMAFSLRLTQFPESLISSDQPAGLLNLWAETEDAYEAAGGFLLSDELLKYLKGDKTFEIAKSEDLYCIEERTGILKNPITRSVEKSALYSVEYYRFKENVGFAIEVDSKLLPENGMLRLGGDTRSAYYYTADIPDIDFADIKKRVLETGKFKLVLITPALFSQGWLPAGIDVETMRGSVNGVELKLIGACVGKPISVGGYDFVKNMPKPIMKAAPAGSVYYFELVGSDIETLFEKFWFKSISDEKSSEGFGITLIGGF